MSFKKGQRVVCVASGQDKYWLDCEDNTVNGPKKNDIVTIIGFDSVGDLFLKEYPQIKTEGYDKNEFRAIVEDGFANRVLDKALRQIKEEFILEPELL